MHAYESSGNDQLSDRCFVVLGRNLTATVAVHLPSPKCPFSSSTKSSRSHRGSSAIVLDGEFHVLALSSAFEPSAVRSRSQRLRDIAAVSSFVGNERSGQRSLHQAPGAADGALKAFAHGAAGPFRIQCQGPRWDKRKRGCQSFGWLVVRVSDLRTSFKIASFPSDLNLVIVNSPRIRAPVLATFAKKGDRLV